MNADDDIPRRADRTPRPSRLAIVLFPLAVCLLGSFWLGLPVKTFFLIAFFAICGVCAACATTVMIWNGLIVPSTVGVRCPDCGRRPLKLAACVSFGPRYYRCDDCGHRCKRDGPTEPWELADGPDDAVFYDPKRRGPAIRSQGRRFLALFALSVFLGAGCIALEERFGTIVGVVAGFVCYLVVSQAHPRILRLRPADLAGVFDREIDKR